MERGRILILGQTKESTYEIRNLLDNKKYELEIALSGDVGKTILSQRQMDLLILHTEMLSEVADEFFSFLKENHLEIPVFIMGEETAKFQQTAPTNSSVRCYEKPYPVSDLLNSIQAL